MEDDKIQRIDCILSELISDIKTIEENREKEIII